MIQRPVYQPLLLTSKSAQLLSLTAISGIILRTQNDEESTNQYICDQSLEQAYQDHETKFIYTSQQSVFDYEDNKQTSKHIKSPSATRIQLEYEKQIQKLKSKEYQKVIQTTHQVDKLNTISSVTPSKSCFSKQQQGNKLYEIQKIRQKVSQKKGRLKCSLELMIIHLNRSHNWVNQSNNLIIKQFFDHIKSGWKNQKLSECLVKLIVKRERLAFDRIKRQQKIKKISLKQNSNKVLQIEEILKREMEKRNKKICTKIGRNM